MRVVRDRIEIDSVEAEMVLTGMTSNVRSPVP